MKAGTWTTLVAAAALFGCGGSSSTGGNGTCNPGQTASVDIASSGVSPKNTCVLPGGTVTFTNHDTVAHDIEGTTPACAALNLGSIAAAGSATATFPTAITCSYTDATRPSDAAFQGSVNVTTGPVTGPGY